MVKSRDFNCEGIKRDEKTFDTKADGSVFTSAKEKPPIPEAEPPVFTSGWILMKPQTSPERRMKRITILKTDEDAKRKNLGVQILWQCKKQTIVANSTTKAEYVAAASCYGQVLWIQNQMLDYGYNFMNTKIFIDNESTICIVKNLVFHSKTKHIEIRHHFIIDFNKKSLFEMFKFHDIADIADLSQSI
ncbi:hypothetical protein Tco_0388898 [Tanacetum coccineum]